MSEETHPPTRASKQARVGWGEEGVWVGGWGGGVCSPTWVYSPPPLCRATPPHLFHRTLSAKRRTVKLVFFFRLPAKQKDAISTEDVDPKNTAVDEPPVKVKQEKKDQPASRRP